MSALSSLINRHRCVKGVRDKGPVKDSGVASFLIWHDGNTGTNVKRMTVKRQQRHSVFCVHTKVTHNVTHLRVHAGSKRVS
jgi:hypothetical protein